MGAFFDAIYTFWNQIIFAISSMRIPFDIIDILAVAFIIYKEIGFLRDTRAGQLVKGAVVLLLVYLVANWFHLASIQWLLSKIVNAVIILAAVIFQPELRRLLEQMGRTKFSKYQGLDDSNAELSRCVDEITRAIATLQSNKTGALIVFERTTQLGDIIATGTVIDAEATPQIIGNIFFPNTPLHDGAMILRQGKIYAAGCILPLTQGNELSKSLGTRHRAAVGMSENSDAVIVVVSEETGTISLAVNGELRRGFDAITLHNELNELLIDEKEATTSFLSHFIGLFNKKGTKEEAKDSQETVAEENKDEE
jgi:diadenylate cyclase